MNNKCCNGCDQGFVPVNANWDFNMDRDASPCQPCTRAASCGEQKACDCQTRNRSAKCSCGRENCDCQACARNAECGCGEKKVCDSQAFNRNASYNCEEKRKCDCQGQSRNISCVREPRNCANQSRWHPAMVKIDCQELGEMYQAAAALKAGTLFPELHKPMRGYCPAGGLCHDDCQAEAFMLWELRLYLSTHPDDKEAMALFRHLCKDSCEPNYATTFLTDEKGGWDWGKNPWPWEYEFNGCKCGECVKEGAGHVCV